jgi:hypothetical protein
VICANPVAAEPTTRIAHRRLKIEAEQKREGLAVTICVGNIEDLLSKNRTLFCGSVQGGILEHLPVPISHSSIVVIQNVREEVHGGPRSSAEYETGVEIRHQLRAGAGSHEGTG